MNPILKTVIVLSGIGALNYFLGFDLRFTIINLIWLITVVPDIFKSKKQ